MFVLERNVLREQELFCCASFMAEATSRQIFGTTERMGCRSRTQIICNPVLSHRYSANQVDG